MAEQEDVGQIIATEQRVDALVTQAMNDHLRSLVNGQPERVRSDFSPQLASHLEEVERLVPSNLRSYDIIEDRVDEGISHIHTRLFGDTTVDLEWVWMSVDGRYRLIEVRPWEER